VELPFCCRNTRPDPLFEIFGGVHSQLALVVGTLVEVVDIAEEAG